jgi:pentatricopeptide repeat protein
MSWFRLEDSRLVHEQLIQSGCESDVFVCNSLVDMSAKCGSNEEAWRMFNKMPSQNVVTWTTMILGHVKCSQGQRALALFPKIQLEGVQPNFVTFVGVLNACASIVAIEEGRCAHEQIIQSGLEQMFLCRIAWLTYAKCGSIEDARRVFNKMPSQNVVTWNAILGGCAMHGCGKEALKHFEQMCEGVHPNDITFICLLSPFGHAGLVDEGMCCYASMLTDY